MTSIVRFSVLLRCLRLGAGVLLLVATAAFGVGCSYTGTTIDSEKDPDYTGLVQSTYLVSALSGEVGEFKDGAIETFESAMARNDMSVVVEATRAVIDTSGQIDPDRLPFEAAREAGATAVLVVYDRTSGTRTEEQEVQRAGDVDADPEPDADDPPPLTMTRQYDTYELYAELYDVTSEESVWSGTVTTEGDSKATPREEGADMAEDVMIDISKKGIFPARLANDLATEKNLR
jgi:hypothetical protein